MKFYKVILLTAVLFAVLIIYPGIYYEDMSDVTFSIMNGGYLTSVPVPLFNNYGAHFLLTHLYTSLECIAPVGWYGIFNIFFMFLATINLLYCLHLSFSDKKNILSVLLKYALGVLLLYDILFLQYTKTSIYLIFSGTWVLTYGIRKNTGKELPNYVILFNLILLIIGMLLRQFSLLLVVMLYFPVLLFQIRHHYKFHSRKIMISLSVFLFLIFLIGRLSSIPYNETDKAYGGFANYKTSVWDNGQSAKSLHLKNQADSTSYECISNYFIPEKKIIQPNYLSHLGIYKSHSLDDHVKASFYDILNKIQIAEDKWKELLSNSGRVPYIFFLLSFILLLSKTNKRLLQKKLFYIFWVFFSLLTISVIVKMEERVLFPSLFILLVVMTEETDFRHSPKKILTIMIACGIIISAQLFIRTSYFNLRSRMQGQNEVEKLLETIKTKHPDKIYMLDYMTLNILGNKVIQCEKPFHRINWFSIDPGYLIFYPEYKQKQEQLTGTDTFEDFIQYASQYKDKFVFIYCTNDRIKLVQKYYKCTYNKEVKFHLNKINYLKGNIFNGHINLYEYSIE